MVDNRSRNTMGIGGWIILIFIVTIVIFVIISVMESNNEKERDTKLTEMLESEKDFTSTTLIKGEANKYFFSVDKERKIILYMHCESSDDIFKKTVFFNQVLDVELVEDSSIVSKKSTTRTIGGGAIGAAVGGGAGMIVGGLSGGSSEKKKVKSIKVRIRIKDIDNPSIVISCLDTSMTSDGKGAPTEGLYGYLYERCLANANQIVDILSVIIDQVDSEEKKGHLSQSQTVETDSITDELSKLVEFKEKGVITDEEFVALKSKLLGT